MKIMAIFLVAATALGGCALFGKYQMHNLSKDGVSETEKKQDFVYCDGYASSKTSLIQRPESRSCNGCNAAESAANNASNSAAYEDYQSSRQKTYYSSFYYCMESKGYTPYHNGAPTPGEYWTCNKKYCSF